MKSLILIVLFLSNLSWAQDNNYEWIKNDDASRVTGCQLVKDAGNEDRPIAECLAALGSYVHWKTDENDASVVKGCHRVTKQRPYSTIEELKFDECFKHLTHYYRWGSTKKGFECKHLTEFNSLEIETLTQDECIERAQTFEQNGTWLSHSEVWLRKIKEQGQEVCYFVFPIQKKKKAIAIEYCKDVELTDKIDFAEAESFFKYDFYRFSPNSELLGAFQFPRNSKTQYRGVTPEQYTMEMAIKAMLGDKTQHIESILFSAVKLRLLGQDIPFLANVAQHFDASLLDDIQKSQKAHKIKDIATAQKYAYEILSQREFLTKSSAEIENSHLNYGSGNHQIFPQKVVFSTIYPSVANIYSKHIVVIDDSKNSLSLDLNFWNKKNVGVWVGTNHPHVDKGEFIYPLAIPAWKVIGYHYRASKPDVFYVFRELPRDLTAAFVKKKIGPKSYVQVIDVAEDALQIAQTLIYENGQVYYAKAQFVPDAQIPLLPSRINPAKVLGVIYNCDSADCDFYDEILDDISEKSYKPYSRNFLGFLANTSINGEGTFLKIFDEEKTTNAKLKRDYQIKNLDQNFLADNDAKAFAQKVGELFGGQLTIHSKLDPTKESNSSLKWELPTPIELKQDEVVYLGVPAKFWGRDISSYRVWQKKITASEKKAFSTIQFFNRDKAGIAWRYVNDEFEKGQLQAPAVKKAYKAEVSKVPATHFNLKDRELQVPLQTQAVRIINYSPETIELSKVEIVFE